MRLWSDLCDVGCSDSSDRRGAGTGTVGRETDTGKHRLGRYISTYGRRGVTLRSSCILAPFAWVRGWSSSDELASCGSSLLPTAAVIPKVERPGQTRCNLFLLYLLRFARPERCRRRVCVGCVSVLRALGPGRSLGFVDGPFEFESVMNDVRVTRRHTKQRMTTSGVPRGNLPDMSRYGLRRVIGLYHSMTESSEDSGIGEEVLMRIR